MAVTPLPDGPSTRKLRQGRFWPANFRQQLLVILGLDQRAQGYVGAIDRNVNMALQGLSGHVPIGNSAAPNFRWNGAVDYGLLAQSGNIPASHNLRQPPNTALPATAGPVIVTSTTPASAVMTALAAMPPGMR